MVGLDPFLYVAIATGFAVGRLPVAHPRWVGPLTLASIVLLIALLGASLAQSPVAELLLTIPWAFGLVGLLLACTLLFVWLLPHGTPVRSGGPPSYPVYTLAFLLALLGGYGVGRAATLPYASLITFALYALLFLVGLELRVTRSALRTIGTPLAAGSLGAVVAAVLFALLSPMDLKLALATTLGFGWYTLTGPIVATRLGATAGLLAFLTNFLREDLTMLLSPSLGPRLGPEALTAWGGATSMDTTLYFVTRYGDPDSGSLALASGLVLTLAASLLVPAVLALPIP